MSAPITVTFDRTELQRLQATWSGSTPKLIAGVTAAAHMSARRMGNNARRNARAFSGSRLRHYPKSITHQVVIEDGEISAVAGPRWDAPQGGFGQFLEHGSVNNAPKPHLVPAMMEEVPAWGSALTRAGVEAL